MQIREIVDVGRAGARRARIEGGKFRLDEVRLLNLGASLEQIDAAKKFLKRYADLDAEVASADDHRPIDTQEKP